MTENKRFKNVEENLEWGTVQYFTYHDEKITDEEIEKLVNHLLNKNEQLKNENQKLRMSTRVDVNEIESLVCENQQLQNENGQLKKELKVYRKLANCSNCKYQNYDWFEDGDEFEICEKGNTNQQIAYHICKEWEEF